MSKILDIDARKQGKKPGDKQEFVCVICPNSCRLNVEVLADGRLDVQGFQCKRGLEYAESEFLDPRRMLITTMRIKNGILPVIPVRSNKEIPREKMLEAVQEVNKNEALAPIKMHDIIMENLLGLEGINVIASRNMEAE